MKLLILAGYTRSFYFRRELIASFMENGYEVTGAAPEPDIDNIASELDMRFVQMDYVRSSTNPLSELKLIHAFKELIGRENPKVIFSYSVKPNLYGPRIAKKNGVKHVYALITGLGNVFIQGGGYKRRVLRIIVKGMYKHSMRYCDRVIFQNSDDLDEFVRMGIVPREKTALVNGSGVNMEHFTPSPLPKGPTFLMVSRLLREKGVLDYLEAARIVKSKCPLARCQLLGQLEPHDNALKMKDLEPYIRDGSIEYLGETQDVRPFYAAASVVVLPSYREGIPRTLLEAMACGRAVITTDAPGCRESVLEGKTGLMVPVGDTDALAAAMRKLHDDAELAANMGREGLLYCAQKYDVRKVNKRMLEIMELQAPNLNR